MHAMNYDYISIYILKSLLSNSNSVLYSGQIKSKAFDCVIIIISDWFVSVPLVKQYAYAEEQMSA